MQKYLKEVEGKVHGLKREHRPEKWMAKNYVGGGQSKLKFLDIKIPEVRRVFKEGFSFSDQAPEKQWKIWDYVWKKSDTFEVMLLASYWAASRPFEETFAHHKVMLAWLARVDNWAHSDELSSHYVKFLEHAPEKLLPVFRKWNRSAKPWFKRQSMVGLLYYARSRKRTLPANLILDFVERHMNDEHYYVQKGVGWTLRECGNVYPRPTLKYLRKNAGRIPAAAWTAATEKLSPSTKKSLTALRVQFRSITAAEYASKPTR